MTSCWKDIAPLSVIINIGANLMAEQLFKNGIYIFTSFDIVNSSLYKYRTKNWFKLYNSIFIWIENEICIINEKEVDKNKKIIPWKVNGDELLYYKRLEIELLDEYIISMDTIMEIVLKKLYCSKNPFRDSIIDIKQVSLKTTIWAAFISSGQEENESYSDHSIIWNGRIDFTGKELDTGFRLSEFTPRSKTSLSSLIIYLLLNQKSKILKKIRIMGYDKLKGIWNNKKYPICIYFRANSSDRIKRSFHYDEVDSPLIESFISRIERNRKFGRINKDDFKEMLDYIGTRAQYDCWITEEKNRLTNASI